MYGSTALSALAALGAYSHVGALFEHAVDICALPYVGAEVVEVHHRHSEEQEEDQVEEHGDGEMRGEGLCGWDPTDIWWWMGSNGYTK
jgi:hypothetical protein